MRFAKILRHPVLQGLLFLLLFGTYVFSVRLVERQPRVEPNEEMRVALPVAVQLLMSGGDRYFAGNMAMLRVLVTPARVTSAESFAVQARVQQDVSWFNPANEDNYYVAAAMLPWYGQSSITQTILKRAANARPNDPNPAFFYAFNALYFDKNPVLASEWLRRAAQSTFDFEERVGLENMAARWIEKSSDVDLAIAVVKSMATEARQPDFRNYLLKRVARLENLKQLREATNVFVEKFGKPPTRLDDLVSAELIGSIPADPFGFGYGLNRNGLPVLYNSEQKK